MDASVACAPPEHRSGWPRALRETDVVAPRNHNRVISGDRKGRPGRDAQELRTGAARGVRAWAGPTHRVDVPTRQLSAHVLLCRIVRPSLSVPVHPCIHGWARALRPMRFGGTGVRWAGCSLEVMRGGSRASAGLAGIRRTVPRDRDERGTGRAWQERRDPSRAGLPDRRGTPPDRGRAGRRQDDAGQGHRAFDRLLVPPDPVHPRPAPDRRHGRQRLQPGAAGLRVQAGRDLREHRPRRRDQPGLPQDAIRAARVHGGAPGHRRHGHPPPRHAVHGDRHAEPDRARGHLPPARSAAGPVHAAAVDRVPDLRRRGRHPREPHRRGPARPRSTRWRTPPAWPR